VSSRRLRIALLGTRGIPANYGGFETCLEEIAPRMAALGHEVTVYCRTPQIDWPEPTYRGVRLAKLPTVRNKYLDTICHSTLAALHAVVTRYDIVLVFGVGNSPVCALLRLGRLPVIINVDGLDWRRDKWPLPAKLALKAAARLAVLTAHRTITDSRNVQRYYQRRFGARLDFVPYGAKPLPAQRNGALSSLDLEPRGYFLYVGRLEPENRVHELVEAVNAVETPFRTVVVGDAPYADDYKARLFAEANGSVSFPGGIYGDGYWELNNNAYAYIFPVGSSGTHPALIEAMACGNCVLARDTPDNRSVGGDTVRYYRSVTELSRLIAWASENPEDVRRLGALAAERAQRLFNWDRVTADYLRLAEELVTAYRRPRRR
jgi:glycosyltransferase involved in cell wall biosynthesis